MGFLDASDASVLLEDPSTADSLIELWDCSGLQVLQLPAWMPSSYTIPWDAQPSLPLVPEVPMPVVRGCS